VPPSHCEAAINKLSLNLLRPTRRALQHIHHDVIYTYRPAEDISGDDLKSDQSISNFIVYIINIMNYIHAARRILMENLLLSMGWLLQCHAHCTSTPNPKIACVK
jgi:hypothetical protein